MLAHIILQLHFMAKTYMNQHNVHMNLIYILQADGQIPYIMGEGDFIVHRLIDRNSSVL